MGEQQSSRAEEIAALRLGLDLGLALIDTAEMYGDGHAETLVGEALAGRREEAYIVSKILPRNATRRGMADACKRSLKRLKTEYLDLYLLHWRESQPLEETLEGFVSLEQSGLIRHYGVSNFDRDDMEEAIGLPGGERIATNQVLYNLQHRGIEWDLLPWSRGRDLAMMAYTPLGNSGSEQRSILTNTAVKNVASRRGATPAQIALAWLLRHGDVITIPKAGSKAHVRENRGALDLILAPDDLQELDAAFPPPHRKIPLEML
jgi:diketogulonate reductase-like aldo/keto reductase